MATLAPAKTRLDSGDGHGPRDHRDWWIFIYFYNGYVAIHQIIRILLVILTPGGPSLPWNHSHLKIQWRTSRSTWNTQNIDANPPSNHQAVLFCPVIRWGALNHLHCGRFPVKKILAQMAQPGRCRVDFVPNSDRFSEEFCILRYGALHVF